MYTLAIIPTYPNFGEMISFSAIGFSVVLIVLILLSIMTSASGLFFSDKKKVEDKSPTPSAPKPSFNAIPKDHEFVISAAVAAMMPELRKDESELIAVISAAVAATLEEEHVIVSFREVVPNMNYALQGRQQIFASKNYIPSR